MNTEVNAAYVLVDYIWAVLHRNYSGVWDKAKYDGITPIVPLSQEPELEEYSGPHIVYGYAEEPGSGSHAHSGGSLTLAVYDDNFRRLSKTITILRVALERDDETARDVNAFSTDYDPAENESFPYRGIRFGYVSLAFVEGGTPEETEGGRQSALISISYQYYADYDVNTSV